MDNNDDLFSPDNIKKMTRKPGTYPPKDNENNAELKMQNAELEDNAECRIKNAELKAENSGGDSEKNIVEEASSLFSKNSEEIDDSKSDSETIAQEKSQDGSSTIPESGTKNVEEASSLFSKNSEEINDSKSDPETVAQEKSQDGSSTIQESENKNVEEASSLFSKNSEKIDDSKSDSKTIAHEKSQDGSSTIQESENKNVEEASSLFSKSSEEIDDSKSDSETVAQKKSQDGSSQESEIGNRIGGPLTDLINFNFLQYASYVICERAIPAVADGLKPVQRRIMHALKEKDDGRFIKVANVVGHTMQYHPHGDASIADALVTLANKRYLIEGQGNYGNIFTGDPAAASRYIECRLTELARNEMFNKELTEWIPSYDGRNKEPVALPCKLPMMLMLGADGIAVGLSTRILPHNFIELLEAQIEILREKKSAPAQINLVPDFQTGGLMDVSEYNKGNGKIKLRARIEPKDKNLVVISELPAGQTTESLTNSIEDAIKKKKLPIRAINDYTSEKVEIELTLTQGYSQEKAISQLYAFTNCETSISSRIIAINEKRPVELNVEDVLRANTTQLVHILTGELELKRAKLLDEFHSKTLVQIFVENRIYKAIEECETYEAVMQAVFDGLNPFKEKLRRAVVEDDVEMLLGIRIKRISRFDIEKNTKDLEEILLELAEVEKDLGSIVSYTVRYLKRLIKQYKNDYPRCTETAEFKAVSLRNLTSSELTISHDLEKGYIGSKVKGDELFQCSSLDKILILKTDGNFQVMNPPETHYLEKAPLWCGVYKRELNFTVVYTHSKVTYIKRFEIGGAIMERDYEFMPSDAEILFFQESAPEELYVKFKPVKNQRISQQLFRPTEISVKGAKAKGKQMTAKPIQYIATEPGRWWNKTDQFPEGVLM